MPLFMHLRRFLCSGLSGVWLFSKYSSMSTTFRHKLLAISMIASFGCSILLSLRVLWSQDAWFLVCVHVFSGPDCRLRHATSHLTEDSLGRQKELGDLAIQVKVRTLLEG